VITLDMGLLVAGTKYRGEFEERLKKLMDEIKQNDEIILVRPGGGGTVVVLVFRWKGGWEARKGIHVWSQGPLESVVATV
jgi:hypothetical protein